MRNKIIEKLIEPVKVETGSFFKIKIKAIRGLNYREIQDFTYQELSEYSYSQLKGD